MRSGETKIVNGIRVGKPDVEPSAASHVRGIKEGNHQHGDKRERRSTGIRVEDHEPIEPRMPKKLSPA